MSAVVETHPSAFPSNVQSKAAYAAEQDVIAGCVLKPERIGMTALEPKHFHPGPNRELWECLLALHAEGESIDTVVVAERCEQIGKRENFAYLVDLVAGFIDANWEYKANLVYRRSQQIDLWQQIERAMNTKDEAIIVAVAEAITQRVAKGSSRAVQAGIDTAYQSMVDEWAASKERPKFTWGLSALDKHLKPMEPTRLHVVVARPGMGKTAFALNVAIANARAGKKVGIISLEQSMEELTARCLCILAQAPMEWIREGGAPPNDVRNIDAAKKILRDLPVMINDATPMTISQLQGWARALVRRYGCEMIVIDYIQKIAGPGRERHMEVANAVMGLKDIARIHKVPVLALAQAKRDAEGRRPTMSDIRDSGFIEQEADQIIAIHRDQDSDGVRSNIAELLVLKNRHGESDMLIKSTYRGAMYRFEAFEGRYADAKS